MRLQVVTAHCTWSRRRRWLHVVALCCWRQRVVPLTARAAWGSRLAAQSRLPWGRAGTSTVTPPCCLVTWGGNEVGLACCLAASAAKIVDGRTLWLLVSTTPCPRGRRGSRTTPGSARRSSALVSGGYCGLLRAWGSGCAAHLTGLCCCLVEGV
jgi:hypothetical protein